MLAPPRRLPTILQRRLAPFLQHEHTALVRPGAKLLSGSLRASDSGTHPAEAVLVC